MKKQITTWTKNCAVCGEQHDRKWKTCSPECGKIHNRKEPHTPRAQKGICPVCDDKHSRNLDTCSPECGKMWNAMNGKGAVIVNTFENQRPIDIEAIDARLRYANELYIEEKDDAEMSRMESKIEKWFQHEGQMGGEDSNLSGPR